MALPVVQFFVRDQAGNTVAAADVTVTIQGGGVADVFSDPDGLNPILQPFNPDPEGFVRFYVAAGVYEIEADYGSSTTTFTHVEVSASRDHVDPVYITEPLDDRYTQQGTLINSGDGLQGGGDLSGNLTLEVDATVVRTAGAQTLAGVKTFSASPVVPIPTASTEAANKQYVDDEIAAVDAANVPISRVLTAGDGLSGGGDLSADRTFQVDASVVRDARQVGTGDGLSGGGDLSGDLVLSVDATVARTTTNINANDGLQGGGDLAADVNLSVDATVVRTTREIATGSGLQGGGTLAGDLTLTVDSSVVRTTRQVIAGDGMDGGGALSADVTLDVDASVVRDPSTVVRDSREVNSGDGLQGGGDLSADLTLAVDSSVVRTTRNLTAGDGLSGGGNLGADRSFAVDATVVRTTGNQVIAGLKTFATPPKGPDPVADDDLATKEYVDIQNGNGGAVPDSRTLTAGDGLTGGGDLSADRTFAVDSSVVRTTRTITTGDGLTGGGTLAGNLTLTVDSSVVRTTGAQSIAGAKEFTDPVLAADPDGADDQQVITVNYAISELRAWAAERLAPQKNGDRAVEGGLQHVNTDQGDSRFPSAGPTGGAAVWLQKSGNGGGGDFALWRQSSIVPPSQQEFWLGVGNISSGIGSFDWYRLYHEGFHGQLARKNAANVFQNTCTFNNTPPTTTVAPTSIYHCANKQYVDSQAGGLKHVIVGSTGWTGTASVTITNNTVAVNFGIDDDDISGRNNYFDTENVENTWDAAYYGFDLGTAYDGQGKALCDVEYWGNSLRFVKQSPNWASHYSATRIDK
jgi:hypothetical protein